MWQKPVYLPIYCFLFKNWLVYRQKTTKNQKSGIIVYIIILPVIQIPPTPTKYQKPQKTKHSIYYYITVVKKTDPCAYTFLLPLNPKKWSTIFPLLTITNHMREEKELTRPIYSTVYLLKKLPDSLCRFYR